MQVRVDNLKKYFGNTRAVDDISFDFSSGEVFGFVGPNGAGKTTTIRILATLLEPTAGDCTVDNISVTQDPLQARRLLGYMPDHLPTHNDMTVRDYLDFFARAYDIPHRRRHAVIDGVEQFTRLTGIRDKFLKALSKGMKQRVSLARAILHDPPVLILDEPAAGLDPRARVELRELLRVLAQQGKAILISSHILTELAEICTGAVIIEKGKILRAGSLERLQDAAEKKVFILIRPLTDLDDLRKHVLEQPFVVNVQTVNKALEVEVNGNDQETALLMTQLINQGHRIAEFRQRGRGLEDIFMHITKGDVQ